MEKGRFEQFLQEAYLLLGGISRVLASCFQSESFCPECGFLLPGIALLPSCGRIWFEEVRLAVQELV